MRALILENPETGSAELRGILRECGFQVFESADPGASLDLLERVGAVDLALVSWDLPDAGALRFVLGLRSARRFDGTRLIMLTRNICTAIVLEAIRMGVDDCLIKPYTGEKLLEKLAHLRLLAC